MTMRGFMARGERDGGAQASEERERKVAPAAPAVRTVAPSTSVDAGSEVEGSIRCKETLRIDGRVKGEVECEKAVLVGQGAKVHARIAADEVQISGVVEGDITARRKITLERTAVVKGDLNTPGIVIEEGAKLKGRIVIGSEAEGDSASAEKKEAKKAPAPRRAASPSPKADEAPAGQVAVA